MEDREEDVQGRRRERRKKRGATYYRDIKLTWYPVCTPSSLELWILLLQSPKLLAL